MTAGDPSRLAGLRRVKLRSLVGGHWTVEGPLVDGPFPGGATLLQPDTGRGWVLVDDGAVAGFGAALTWARRHQCDDLHVLVEDGALGTARIMARRARLFARPAGVWRIDGRDLHAAVPSPVDPLPASGVDPLPASGADPLSASGADPLPASVVETLSAEIAAHGGDPVFEHGTLRAEVLGLEVARAVQTPDGGWRLSVGVGRHDREAREALRPGETVGNALDDVIGQVRWWRTVSDRRHPANMLAREKLLRAAILARPDLAGAVSLAPVPSPLPVDDLRAPAPAGAVGIDAGGQPLVVVCSTGVDVDLVPTAADIRLLHAPAARLVLVVPRPDAYPVTVDLARGLAHPAEVRPVAPELLQSGM